MIIVYRFVSRFIWCYFRLEKVLLIQPIEAIQV